MVAKEWWEARWKFVLAAVAVLAFAAFAPASYGMILKDVESQIEMARAELESPEEFMGPPEVWPPGYTPARQEASLRDHIEEMRQPDYPVKMAKFQMMDLRAGEGLIVLAPLAALLGVALVSGEVSRGTIFLLLSRPISRTRVLLTKYLVGAAVLLAAALLGSLGIVVSGYAHGYPDASIDTAGILASSGLLWMGTLSVLSVATLASVLFRDVIRSVIATAVALYAIFYLPDLLRDIASYWTASSEQVSFGDQMAEQAWYQSFEAFRIINYWFVSDSYGGPFTEYQSAPLFNVLVCLIAAALPLIVALWLFRRRSY